MSSPAKNILIIGGGLAGCFQAATAAQRGHRVTLIDDLRPKSASRVAAGLFNVLTGREVNMSWMATEMLAALKAFLDDAAFADLQQYVHFMPIYKPFVDGHAYNDWMIGLEQPEFAALAQHEGRPQQPMLIHNPIGGLRIVACGWAEVGKLCTGMLDILQQRFELRLLHTVVDYADMDPVTGEVRTPGAEGIYDEIVFAEGMGILDNPWFQFVQIRPLKGQVIDLQLAPGLDETQILMRKTFLIPKGNHAYTAGSTYELRFEDDETTPEGIESVESSVREQVNLPFQRTAARAAIRPTTPNRRPILGRHPDFSKLIVLNGLGTKGVLQAPLMSLMLRDWLDGAMPQLPKDVDVNRFLRKNA